MPGYMQRRKPFYAEQQCEDWVQGILKEIEYEKSLVMGPDTIIVEEEFVR